MAVLTAAFGLLYRPPDIASCAALQCQQTGAHSTRCQPPRPQLPQAPLRSPPAPALPALHWPLNRLASKVTPGWGTVLHM